MTAIDEVIGRKQWTAVNKFGRNSALGAGTEDLWDVNAAWVAPTVARIHNIVSTSVSDDGDPAGVGAQIVRIWGLTAWDRPEVSEDIELNGTTDVPTVNAYVVIHRMQVIAWGATNINVGVISATAVTDATVTAQIAVAVGQSRMAVYGIPAGRTLYMTQFEGNLDGASAALTDVAFILLANSDPATEETNFRQLHRGTAGMDTFQGHFVHPFNPYLPIVGPHLIKLQVTSDVAAAVVNGGFDGYLVTD